MNIDDEKIKEFVLDSSLVSRKDIDEAEKLSTRKEIDISEALVNQGKITEDDMRRVQANVLGIPFVSLKGQKIDFAILSLIPEPIARSHNILAFNSSEKELEVAMLDVDDLKAIDFVKKKVGLKILPRLTDSDSLKEGLLLYQKSLKAEFGDLIKEEAVQIDTSGILDKGEDASEQDLKKLAEDLPVVRIVDTLIKHAIIQGASDIHIEPMEKQVLVRYRIDGILHDAMTLPKNAASGISARIKVLAKLKLDEKRLPQDGRFKIETDKDKVSFRVSTLPTHFGEKTVMRLLREGTSGFTLEKLGFHGDSFEQIYSATRKRTGIILTTGPTGSGKTTTSPASIMAARFFVNTIFSLSFTVLIACSFAMIPIFSPSSIDSAVIRVSL